MEERSGVGPRSPYPGMAPQPGSAHPGLSPYATWAWMQQQQHLYAGVQQQYATTSNAPYYGWEAEEEGPVVSPCAILSPSLSLDRVTSTGSPTGLRLRTKTAPHPKATRGQGARGGKGCPPIRADQAYSTVRGARSSPWHSVLP